MTRRPPSSGEPRPASSADGSPATNPYKLEQMPPGELENLLGPLAAAMEDRDAPRPQTKIRNPELLTAVTTRGRNELLAIFDNLDEVGRGMLITTARRIEEQRRWPGNEE